jgi:GH43 family beta-xylosidase
MSAAKVMVLGGAGMLGHKMFALNNEYRLGYTCDPIDEGSIQAAIEQLLANRENWTAEGPRRFLASSPGLDVRYDGIMNFPSRRSQVLRETSPAGDFGLRSLAA